MLYSLNVDSTDNHRGPVISRLTAASELRELVLENLSFFDPFLKHFIREALLTDGEVYIARDDRGTVSGAFLYDSEEKAGSIFTRSREVFDAFSGLKNRMVCFSEVGAELRKEIFHVYTVNLENYRFAHRFNHEIYVAEDGDLPEISSMMRDTYRNLNTKWIDVAFGEGDRCFVARINDRVAGVAWLSHINGAGRLHSLVVSHQYRRLGIGTDLLFARLLWLKGAGARYAFSEIADHNTLSIRIAGTAGMQPAVEMYQYVRG